ncbi:MAG: hypothetical protein WCD79_16235 [Chthoniobacteraceae bacterium]
MARYKVTALKDITVSARIHFQTLRPLPQDSRGQSQGSATMYAVRPEIFKMPAGASREDVALVMGVSDGPRQPVREGIAELGPGESVRIRDLLLVERVE